MGHQSTAVNRMGKENLRLLNEARKAQQILSRRRSLAVSERHDRQGFGRRQSGVATTCEVREPSARASGSA